MAKAILTNQHQAARHAGRAFAQTQGWPQRPDPLELEPPSHLHHQLREPRSVP